MIEEEFGVMRDELMLRLKEAGIETRTFFIPMNEQPIFLDMGLSRAGDCPVAKELSNKGLYLPSGSGLLPEQIRYICQTIKAIKSG